MKIAVIGSGISGLGAAWLLQHRHHVTLYEADSRLGGHSNTVDVPTSDGTIPVDTGFIVFNAPNYPQLVRLFDHLGVPSHDSDMSFGVSIEGGRIEYSGSSYGNLFAQWRNLLRPRFHRMILDILRFNRDAPRFLATADSEDATLGDYLDGAGFGHRFQNLYLLPMAAAIWSAPLGAIRNYPARSFIAFFKNHGLLTVNEQLQWRTVTGGARRYVARLIAPLQHDLRVATPVVAVRRTGDGVEIVDGRGGCETFDQVVLACHADQALAMIDRPSTDERAILGSFRCQPNHAVLHRDPALMPRRRRVWSSWNYLSDRMGDDHARVSVTYWMNRLQGFESERPIFVSLNPLVEPQPESVIARFDYRHPVFDLAALDAQARLPAIQGRERLWFAGAWCGHGFHEDGLVSGLAVGRALGVAPPWEHEWQAPAPRRSAAATLPAAAAPS